MAFQDHREEVDCGDMPGLSPVGVKIRDMRKDGSDAVLVSLSGIVRLLPGAGPLPVRILVQELRGIHLSDLLERRVVLPAVKVRCAAKRVVHDKRLDHRTECC